MFQSHNGGQGIPLQLPFQHGPFVSVLANFSSLFKLQLLSPGFIDFSACHQLTMGWYEHLCYCFCTVYQSNVSADWGLGGRIKPVLHRAWWITGFTYHFETLRGTGRQGRGRCWMLVSQRMFSEDSGRKGSDLDSSWQLNTQNTDKLWKFTSILSFSYITSNVSVVHIKKL